MDRSGAFGGPTWNKEAHDWNYCFRFDSNADRFLIADDDCGVGRDANAAVRAAERDIAAYAKAVCRAQVAGSDMLMSGFFFTPRKAITGVHFDFRKVLDKNKNPVVHYTLIPLADEPSIKNGQWLKGKVLQVLEEHQVIVFESAVDHPFIPLDNFSTKLEVGDKVACIGYNYRTIGSEINNFWVQLLPEEQKAVTDSKWRPTVSDIELQTLPEHKIVSPGQVVEFVSLPPITTSAKVTCSLYFGSTCGVVIRLRSDEKPAVVGRVEGTVWTHHLNMIHVVDEDFIHQLSSFVQELR